MKREATKAEIIRATQQLIARNGIRAIRVDEIVRMLGISKRTLYELFADKNDLVDTSLEIMSLRQQERIIAGRKRRCGNPLQRTFRLVGEYTDSLYLIDRQFLSDIRRKAIFADRCEEYREFWQQELTRNLEICQRAGLLLPEVPAQAFAMQLLDTLFELRLNDKVREELTFYTRTILRGAATHRGIELIDSK